MNNIIKRKWNQNSMVIIEDLQGMAFQAESGGHTFQISGIDGEGNAVALSGTPAGVMLRADGQDVTLTCSASEGVISATLPANAYSVPGRFGLTIFLTSDGQKTAIYAAVGTVGKTSSGTVAPPAGSDVVTLVNQINTAIAAIPANYNACFAPAYSTSGLYSVGQYVTYNGNLYRCNTAITTAETWTAAHWTQTNLGADVYDLKSALNVNVKTLSNFFNKSVTSFFTNTSDWEQGAFSQGAEVDNSTRVRTKDMIFIPAGATIRFITSNYVVMLLFDIKGNYVSQHPDTWSHSPTAITIQSDSLIRLAVRKIDSSAILPSEAATSIQVFYPYFNIDAFNILKNAGEISVFTNTSDWEQGAIVNGANVDSTTRIRTKGYFYVPANSKIVINIGAYSPAGHKPEYTISIYSTDGAWISTSSSWLSDRTEINTTNAIFVRFVSKYANSDTITASNINITIKIYANYAESRISNIEENAKELEQSKKTGDVFIYDSVSDWEQGSIASDGTEAESSARIRTGYIFVPNGATLICLSGDVSDAHYINYFAFAYYDTTKAFTSNNGSWKTGYYEETFIKDAYVRVSIRKNDSTDLTPSDMCMTIIVSTGKLSQIKVLALGDSICYGARNRRNGFIGKTGCKYKNVSVAGASISTAKTNNIINQLLNVSNYTPDAIITNGGINDYSDGVQMGDVPTRVIDPNNDSPETMDKTTVMGGLQYLFYKMIKLYPNAQRIFVMPHRTWDRDRIAGTGGWNFDTFYDNVKKVCEMYGVKIVDIYTKSSINTRYSEYRSATNYSYTPPETEKGWVNSDGVHPLPYGYEHGYTQYVAESLKTVVSTN